MPEEITINEFIKTSKKELTAFIKFWEDGRKKSIENFPEKMGEGDWFEQFRFYVENEEKDEFRNS
jgi:hypothetical protein